MNIISLGIGSPSSIPAIVLFGLSPAVIDLFAVDADVVRLPVRATTRVLPVRRTITTADDSI